MRFLCQLTGALELQKAADFVGSIIDDELGLEIPRASDSGMVEADKTRIAILCSPTYGRCVPLEQCVHWIPGWLAKDLPADVQGEDLVAAIIEDTIAQTENEVGKMVHQLENEADDVLKFSLEEEIDRKNAVKENLVQLLREVWREFGIVAKPTLCDGDCGVHMAMAFGESVLAGSLLGKEASPADVQQIIAAYRTEIGDMWVEMSHDCLWQQIWQRFVEGRVDLRRWRELAEPVATPQLAVVIWVPWVPFFWWISGFVLFM